MTSDGIYLIESDNKLILTDGDYDDPKIYLVAVIESKYNDVIQFVKEFIYDEYEAGNGSTLEEPLRLAQSAFVFASINFRTSGFYQAYIRGKERKRSRADSSELGRKAEKNEVNEQEKASAADDTAINDSSAQHTPEEQRIIEEYKAAVDPVLVKFYKDSKTKSKAKKSFEAHGYQLKNVSDKSARDIRRLTGVNTFGWKTVYDVRQAYHTYVEHGESGRSDHSMSNDEDVGRMQYVLDNYDLAVEFGTTDAYWESKPNGKNRTAKTVAFMKKVDGTYFIVEAVPNTSARTVNIVTAFIVAKDKLPYGNLGKKVAEVLTQPTDATNAPQRYGQTATVRSSSANGSITRGDTDSQVGKSRRSIQTDSEYLSLAAEGFNSENDDIRLSVGETPTEQLRIEELSRLVADYDRASEAARKTLDEQMKRDPKQIAKEAI